MLSSICGFFLYLLGFGFLTSISGALMLKRRDALLLSLPPLSTTFTEASSSALSLD